jgi:thiol-disulfide isomerase/thioredoxin
MQYHKLLKFFLCFSVSVVSSGYLSGTAHAAETSYESDGLFQNMIFHDSSGKAWTLKQWVQTHQKPVMVVAWAKWCGPCMREMPYVQKMKEILQRHLDVLPIDIDPPSSGHKYALTGIQMPLFYSKNLSRMMTQLDMTGIPAVLIYSRKGVLLHKEIGAKDWSEKRNIQILKDILKLTLNKERDKNTFQGSFNFKQREEKKNVSTSF